MATGISHITTIIITMTNLSSGQSLIRLMTWLSPAFPIGSFAYSHGLEAAFAKGALTIEDFRCWLETLLTKGSIWCDAVLLAESWRLCADGKPLDDIAALGKALSGSPTRELETITQGKALITAMTTWTGSACELPEEIPLPVAFGAVAAQQKIELEAALPAYLNAMMTNLIQAVMRLGHLGQQEGVALLASFETMIIKTAERAQLSSLDDLGSASFMAEIMSLSHETLPTRIFRS